MNPSILLTCALMLAQPGDRAEWQLTPQLAPGLDLVYRGEFLEENLGQNVQRQTRYRIDASMLVLDAGVREWQTVLLTTLKIDDGRDPKGPFMLVGANRPDGPSSLRLEPAKVELQGRIRNADKRLVQVALKGPPTLESGFIVAAPLTRVGKNYTWDAPEEGRPLIRWQVLGTESCGGLNCVKLIGIQQTEDWERGRADVAVWRRRDVVWLHPQLNVAQRVERIIERRDPGRAQPTERVTVRYDLEGHVKYPTVLLRERSEELLKACEVYDLTQRLIKQPATKRAQIDIQIQRLAMHLDKSSQSSPYRPVFAHLKSTLEHAKKGEAPVPHTADEPMQVMVRGASIGQRAPDFLVSSFTQEQPTPFRAKQGQPTVVLFYNPTTELGNEMMRYAKKLSERKGPPVTILAMAVAPNADVVRKQHVEMRLPFPIHDGNAMRLTFGVEATPRVVIIDPDGVITFAQTGWGLCTPEELDDVLDRFQKKVAGH